MFWNASGDQFFDHGVQRLGQICDDLVRFIVRAEHLVEERAGRTEVASAWSGGIDQFETDSEVGLPSMWAEALNRYATPGSRARLPWSRGFVFRLDRGWALASTKSNS